MTEANDRVRAFLSASGIEKTRTRNKVWFYANGKHVIADKSADVPCGAQVLAFFSIIDKHLRARMLVASLWSGDRGVVHRWPSWRRARESELRASVSPRVATAVINGLVEAAELGDVRGVADEIARYHELIADHERQTAFVRWVFENLSEDAAHDDGSETQAPSTEEGAQ